MRDVRRVGAVLALAALAACSKDVATRGRWPSSAGPAVTGRGILAGAAPVPLDVEVLSPAPASWLASADVTIAGVVRRPGVTRVTVNGVAATLGASGDFSAPVRLDAGIARATVVAVDQGGGTSSTTVSYAVGPTRPFTAPVARAVVARLDANAFPALGAAVAGGLDQLDWTALLVPLSPIPVSLGGVATVELDLVSVAHGSWKTTITPGVGVLLITTEVPDVKVKVVLHTGPGSPVAIALAGEAEARLARAVTTATLALAPGAPPRVVVARPAVTLTGTTFAVQGPLSGPLSSAALALVQQSLTGIVEGALADVLEKDLPRLLEDELRRATSPPPLPIQGVPFTFTGTPERLDVDPLGATLVLAVDVAAPVASTAPAAPGFLAGAGPPPALGPGRQVAAAVSPELLAKATTVAWRAGALDLEVDGKAWSALGAGLPPLDAAGLSQLVPELATVLAPATPLVVRLRPRLPPRLVVAPGPALAAVELGEVHLELLAVDGGRLVPALDLALHGTVPCDPSLQAGALAFSTGPIRPRLFFSVAAQPLVRVDARALETRLSIVVDALLPGLLAPLRVVVPPIGTRPLANPSLSAGGPLGDHLTVAGDL